MGRLDELEEPLRRKFATVLPLLNERQQRLLLAAEAVQWGHGGIRLVARASGKGVQTVRRGVCELEDGVEPSDRVRRPGGGRKPTTAHDPGLLQALMDLVDDSECGDPMKPLRWTSKSTRNLSRDLGRLGHPASATTVAALLKREGFSLQGNARVLAGAQHPDRDAQFRHINRLATDFLATGDPVISVDTKKKEHIGLYARPGTEWRRHADPVKVRDHDFTNVSDGKAIPYGIYDVGRNTGWVVVGTDHDTAAFAAAAIRDWWHERGRHDYPTSRRLLITADAGGSNSARSRAWKAELAHLAAQTGLAISISHIPPGTSKWNKVEHRLFSFISLNWRARPLTSYDVAINLIGSTTNRTGLTVTARLDTTAYPAGIRIDDAHMNAIEIIKDAFHGEWNYTFPPRPDTPAPPRCPPPAPPTRATAPARLRNDYDTYVRTHPTLTGMPRADLDTLVESLAQLHAADTPRTRRGRRPQLAFHEQVWATILYRRCLTGTLTAKLFNITPTTLKRTINTIDPLLKRHGHTITPTLNRLHHPIDVTHAVIRATSTPH